MTLHDWQANGWIKPHQTSRQEVANRLAAVARNLHDAGVAELSPESRLTLGYHAVLELAYLALAATGFRPARERGHEWAIGSLRFTIGSDPAVISVLDGIRKKRNRLLYEGVGSATETEARQVLELAGGLRDDVVAWLERQYPEFTP